MVEPAAVEVPAAPSDDESDETRKQEEEDNSIDELRGKFQISKLFNPF
jgi:hypothetical protein